MTSVRTAKAGQPDVKGTYETAVINREIGYKKRRKIRDLIKAEREYVASLPGKFVIFKSLFYSRTSHNLY